MAAESDSGEWLQSAAAYLKRCVRDGSVKPDPENKILWTDEELASMTPEERARCTKPEVAPLTPEDLAISKANMQACIDALLDGGEEALRNKILEIIPDEPT